MECKNCGTIYEDFLDACPECKSKKDENIRSEESNALIENNIDNSRCLSGCGRPPEAGYATPLCSECRNTLVNRPFPIWIKASMILVIILVAVSMTGFKEAFSTRLVYERAANAEKNGRYEDAVKGYLTALGKNEGTLDFWTKIFLCLYKNNSYLDAISVYKEKMAGKEADKDTVDQIDAAVNDIRNKVLKKKEK